MKYIIAIIMLGIGIAGFMGGLFFPEYSKEIFLGMLAPLLISVISIYSIKLSHAKSPAKVTATLTKSFLIKMIVFALYFIIILYFYAFEPIPFVISFTGFFILFYAIEAAFLNKLYQTGK